MLRISQPPIISFMRLLGKPGIPPALSGIVRHGIALLLIDEAAKPHLTAAAGKTYGPKPV
jgi:hypothetical protein